MPASLLWLSCRSALVAPRARLARGGLRSAGVPAAAAFRCVVPGARPGSVAAREG
jgi:hypothetical protein